jgi:hypothetical protein
VSGVRAPRLEVDGRAATTEQVWTLDMSASSHFTAMQVRDRQTLGLDFHLARLDAATRSSPTPAGWPRSRASTT